MAPAYYHLGLLLGFLSKTGDNNPKLIPNVSSFPLCDSGCRPSLA